MAVQERIIKAFITESGKVIKEEAGTVGTMVLVEDQFNKEYSLTGSNIAKPPFNPEFLTSLMNQSTYHTRCIKQKAADTVGLGYQILPVTQEGVEPNPVNKETLKNFLDNIHPELTLIEILEMSQIDYESVGWQLIEIIRNRGQKPSRFNHVPAKTCRIKMDGTGWIQRRGTKERHFKNFGDLVVKEDPQSKLSQTEILNLQHYSPTSDWYGVPDYIPAIGAMIGNVNVRDYNINFFDNNGIPQYAVIITGGDLTADVEKIIEEHFKTNLKGSGNNHKTLILSLPEGVKVEFKALQADVKDGQFRMYRIDNRDEIIASHGVPPSRIGVGENGVGSKQGSSPADSTQIYKNAIIDQRQAKLEKRLNRIIADKELGLGITDWKIKFNEIDMNNATTEAEIDDKQLKNNTVVVNEVRKKKGMSDVPWGNTPLTQEYLNLIGAGPNSAGGAQAGGEIGLDVSPEEKAKQAATTGVKGTTMGKLTKTMALIEVKKYTEAIMSGEKYEE